ncbi:p-loop containing nucleoside triphosphate hydrolase [Pleurostoma richardsiae]|uniref:P-loop containing nucleoside triphosphate hydrolase n=1 Tax=Pleurostoma richardsiae TaxID=41990 RepID=A0AA38S0I2_9PEZI|nr:p-loop containing nucleoside triphosphate hydrolase [Pleurostoma richardsiae]
MTQSGQGPPAALGFLYDARSEKALIRSILKTTDAPPESIKTVDGPGLTYKHTSTDSLEEKFSSLGISAELGVSILCGILGGGWCAEYLSKKKLSTCVRQASTLCITPTTTQTLRFETESLKSCVDVTAFQTEGATHVISGIEWGARTLVSLKETKRDLATSRKIKSKLGNNPSDFRENPMREENGYSAPPLKDGMLSRLAKSVGEMHLNGKVESDSTFSSTTTSLDFEIIADVGNIANGGIPATFGEVGDFLRTIPSSLKDVNDGKGVVIAFHLSPIKEVAKIFQVEIQHDAVVKQLEQDGLDGSIAVLEKLGAKIRNLGDYVTLIEQHSFCVPMSHVKDARQSLKFAKGVELDFKKSLATAIVEIRSGRAGMESLLNLLHENDSSDSCDEHPSCIVGKYTQKISFADMVREAGAEYISHDDLEANISSKRIRDIYIFHFNRAAQGRPGWNEDRQTLIDLLNDQADQYSVLVVDYDAPKPKDLENAYIEQRRGGKVIVPNVTQKWKELADLCQLKCSVTAKADRTRTVHPPPSRRVVRVPCPGENCFATGKLKWTCPICQDLVCYGFTDDYLYCLCSRYLFTDAVFKCNHAVHGPGFVKYSDEDLHKRLKALDPLEEYNILILGKSGVGKSMFINALVNYLDFESLHDAMADAGPLRYVIPYSFFYMDEGMKEHEVVVGKESIWERFSKAGKSSTRKSLTYCFSIDGKIVRFIDTPGINDTAGVDQDHKNSRDILKMLESIDKLSAILILLPPNEPRLDATFKFCMSELLSRLHRDASKNILFGFTNSSITNFTLGATRVPLDRMLQKMGTGIARGESNQYFFDAKALMYLAAYKQKLPEMAGGIGHHAALWAKSAGAVHRLITTVMGLPTHNVSITIKLNRTLSFLEGMAKPLAKFTTSTKIAQRDLEDAERKLLEVIAHGGNLAEKAKSKITITVPVRHNLGQKRTVCCHPNCVSQVQDENGVLRTVFKTVCHDNCDIKAADEIKGVEELRSCNPFWRWYNPFSTYECKWEHCKHDWREHVHISYEFRDEVRTIDDEAVLDEIKSNEEAMQLLKLKMKTAKEYQEVIRKEREQIQAARALFFVYVSQNAVGTSRANIDATIQYLDLHIAIAKQDGRTDEATELTLQKSTHMEEVKALEDAIALGTICLPDEQTVDRTFEELKDMRLFGKHLSNAVDSENEEPEESRFIFVESNPKMKKRRWFRWSS